MIKRHKSQTGMTGISVVVVLFLIGLFVTVGLKMFPLYLDSFKVASVVSSLPDDERARGASSREIKALILKKLRVDDVKHLTQENIIIEKKGSIKKLRIEYEARSHLLGNLDVVLVFNSDEVELR